jgi:tetratricopeptide (TPR) repeat protein
LEEAITHLERLVEEEPGLLPAWLVLGGLYSDVRRFSDAAAAFRRFLSTSPKSELASLGLFHALWDLGREEEAVAEMHRFLEVADSKMYRLLLCDLGRDAN